MKWPWINFKYFTIYGIYLLTRIILDLSLIRLFTLQQHWKIFFYYLNQSDALATAKPIDISPEINILDKTQVSSCFKDSFQLKLFYVVNGKSYFLKVYWGFPYFIGFNLENFKGFISSSKKD